MNTQTDTAAAPTTIAPAAAAAVAVAVAARPTVPGSRGARRFAYLGVATGLVVSVAANLAHSFVAPPGWGAGKTWAPEPGAVLGAMFWPVALLLTTEILTRKRWPAGWVWLVVRLAGLLPVAGVAAVISYQHLHGLLQHYHESDLAATIGPLSIDGLMVMASAALIAPDRVSHTATGLHDTGDATTPTETLHASPDSSGASWSDETHSSPESSAGSSSAGSSRRASGASPRRSSPRSSGGSSAGSPAPSSGGSAGAGRRADDETLRALVATARADRPGAGEPAVRRLLVEAGLSASAVRVRAALADPDGSTTAGPAPVPGPQTGPDHTTGVTDAEAVPAAGQGPDEEAAA